MKKFTKNTVTPQAISRLQDTIEYSNKPFKESPIRLNIFLKDLETFSEKEIKERVNKLTSLVLQIWSYLKLDKEVLAKYKKVKARSK